MNMISKWMGTAALVSLALSGAAQAGGFQRGTADTDILFEPGSFSTRAAVTYISPQRGFTSINGQSGDFSDYTGNYTIPSYSVKFGGDDLACAGTFVETFAAEGDYTGSPDGALPLQRSSALTTSRTRTIDFHSNEVGATCRVSYQHDIGRFSLLGGVFMEDFNFDGSSFGFRNLNPQLAASGVQGAALVGAVTGAIPNGQITLPTLVDVENQGSFKAGYRLGVAYERPEIALRVQAIYRSEVRHDDISGSGTVQVNGPAYVTLNGEAVPLPPVLAGQIAGAVATQFPVGTVIPVASELNTAISPQSFTVNAQTGIAEGTLLLASFRWTDWSTNRTVVNTISSPVIGTSASEQPYYWRDGYTVSLGVGRAFNETVSGLVAIGYDRGVSTGADTTYTDLYTLSGGIGLRQGFAELRFGGLVGYWTDGVQSTDRGAYFDATVGDDWVLGANASLKFTF